MRSARLLTCVDVARPRAAMAHCAHLDLGEFWELGVLAEGGGGRLRTPEAARLLDVSRQTVVNWVERGWLRAIYTDGGHRRIDRDSVDDLLPILREPPGPKRDAALEGLRRRNLGEEEPEPPTE
jgi:excisionase family DNA binding protein